MKTSATRALWQGLALSAVGLGLFMYWAGWKIALAFFLWQWGNNRVVRALAAPEDVR